LERKKEKHIKKKKESQGNGGGDKRIWNGSTFVKAKGEKPFAPFWCFSTSGMVCVCVVRIKNKKRK